MNMYIKETMKGNKQGNKPKRKQGSQRLLKRSAAPVRWRRDADRESNRVDGGV